MSFFNMRLPTFNSYDGVCCNDPFCDRNRVYNNNQRTVRPERRDTNRSAFGRMSNDFFDNFGQTFDSDPFFGNGLTSSFFGDEQPSYKNTNRRVRTARTKPQNAPVSAQKNYYRKAQEPLRKSYIDEDENKENIAPRFYSTLFESNSVNRNGNKTTINKKQYKDDKKSETFITKITEDKDGNKNIEKLNPELYNNELKAIMEQMEETGAVLMEIAPKEHNETKMLEENNNNQVEFRSIDSDKISNTDSGNNMF